MISTRKLVIFGASGHGKVVADIGQSVGFSSILFVDDSRSKAGSAFYGHSVMSWEQFLDRHLACSEMVVALGIGDNRNRERCFNRVIAAGFELVTLIHSSAVVAPSARLGLGTVVMATAVVNADARVGDGAILNTGSVVEHDNRIGRFVHLSPKVALGGDAHVGDRTHLGLGAVVLPGRRVGTDARVGAGAAVIRPVPDGLTVAGVPARPLRSARNLLVFQARGNASARYSTEDRLAAMHETSHPG